MITTHHISHLIHCGRDRLLSLLSHMNPLINHYILEQVGKQNYPSADRTCEVPCWHTPQSTNEEAAKPKRAVYLEPAWFDQALWLCEVWPIAMASCQYPPKTIQSWRSESKHISSSPALLPTVKQKRTALPSFLHRECATSTHSLLISLKATKKQQDVR